MAFYKDGVVSIPNVTGDIVITASAVPSVTPIVNLVDTYGVATGNRISLSSGNNSTQSGYTAFGSDQTKYIPISGGDVIRIKGSSVNIPSASDGKSAICGYGADGTHTGASQGNYLYVGMVSFSCTHTNGIYTITVPSTAPYPNLRLCFPCTDTSDLIITINQEIPS